MKTLRHTSAVCATLLAFGLLALTLLPTSDQTPLRTANAQLTTFADMEALSSVRGKINNTIQQRERVRLGAVANSGQAVVTLDSQVFAGAWVAVGAGTADEEIHQIASSSGQDYTLDANLRNTHASGAEIVIFRQQPMVARGLTPRTVATTQAADSAAALQDFIDDMVGETSQGATIVVPPGIYDLSTSIDLPDGCKLYGGHFVAQSNLSYVFGSDDDDVSIENVTIHGDFHDAISLGPAKRFFISNVQVFGGDGSGVRLSDCQKGTITDCRFEKGTNSPFESNADILDEGVLVAGGTGQTATDIWVTDCYFEGMNKAGAIFNDGKQCRVLGCFFKDIAGDGNTTGDAISFYSTGTGGGETQNTGCLAANNVIDGANRMGVYVQGSKNATITDNVINNTCITLVESVTLMGGAIGCVPDQSTYAGSGYYIGGVQETLIARNHITNTTGGPAIAFAGDTVHVIDNVIDAPKHYGISARGCDNCVITGNDFVDCPTDFHHWQPGTLTSGTHQSGGSSTTAVLAAGASASDDAYQGAYILTGGTNGPGQRRFITDYDGTTKTITVSTAWTVVPNASTTYVIETNRWHNNTVVHGSSNRGIEPRVLAGLTVEEGEDDYFLEREFTAVTDLVGGQLGQTIRFYESYTGVTWFNNDNSANSPVTLLDNANHASVDAGTSAGGVLTFRKGGLLYRPSKVLHDDNSSLTDLTATYDNDSTSSGSTISLVAAEDYLQVCFPRPIDSCYVTIGSTANDQASVITAVELSDGQSGWNGTTLVRDHSQARDVTTGENGKTFSGDGWIQWTVPEDRSWDDDTYDGTAGRWVRFTFNNDWTASVVIEEIDVKSWGWVQVVD